ncbi:MAG: AbrB/MazE/SpoVT family DNA-binding domain-containing protein [Balneolales bacterium]|nr:AbrB/MazE/SpoVT family DNA-binding domain-containing protein [Balneolales bacterium]
MKTKLIRIGNSQGVRIPKPLIEESGLSGEIEMILRDNEIVLRAAEPSRKGWNAAFRKMAAQADDQLEDWSGSEPNSEWDETEWSWEDTSGEEI